MEVSEIIKEARTKKGMTQQQLADCVYVTRQTISKWELGGLRYNSDKLKKAL